MAIMIYTLIDRQYGMVTALNDEVYFKQFFLELGALCWPNGLELSHGNIHQKLVSNTNCVTRLKWPNAVK